MGRARFADLSRIVAGNLLITAAYAYITVPNRIVNGGVTSLALVVQGLTGWDVGILATLTTLALLGVCLVFLGMEYFMKSLFSSLCYLLFFNGFLAVPPDRTMNMYPGVVVAAVMVGIGYYLCISARSSAVGFDILALVLKRRNDRIDVAVAMRYINLAVLASGFLRYGAISIALGAVFILIQSSVLKFLLGGGADKFRRRPGSVP